MPKIQIVLLFTSLQSFSAEQKAKIQSVVVEEYQKAFNADIAQIDTQMYEGFSSTTFNDILIAISGGAHIMNEGTITGRMRDQIATRLSMLNFMRQHGFNGRISVQHQAIKEPDTKNVQSQNTDTPSSEPKLAAPEQAYTAQEPMDLADLQLHSDVEVQIENALKRMLLEKEIFPAWGLYAIMPKPKCALSFYGPPGTGKSMAAETIARKLGKKIIRASYANIESKFVGEGPKNVNAIFKAAEDQDAVLFIDEAESLLSKRLVNVNDPAGQSMNSMRSQFLICLEAFHGIVVFASNLAVNYDEAIESRVTSIKIDFPDAELRERIWRAHLYPNPRKKVQLSIPLAADVDIKALAEAYPICGRDIRGAVIDACVEAWDKGLLAVNQECLQNAAAAVLFRAEQVKEKNTNQISPEAKAILARSIERQMEGNKEKEQKQ